jgi:hypothetical protein
MSTNTNTQLGDSEIIIKHDADGDGKIPGEKEDDEEDEDEEKKELKRKKLAAEEDEKKEKEEKEKKEKEEKNKTEMSGAMSNFKSKTAAFRLALRSANLRTRFASLRTFGKVTPAELKKIDFNELASANDQTIEAVLKSYENRQPVILMGQHGSSKGIDAAKVAKDATMARLEAETRANMRFTNKNATSTVKMNEGTSAVSSTKIEVDNENSDHEEMWGKILSCLASGDENGAKEMFFKSCKMEMKPKGPQIDEESMANLMGAFAEIETEFTNIVRLSAK